MAEKSEQGTGKHAHKDSQEPRPQTKGEEHGKQQSRTENPVREEGRQQSGGEERRSEQERSRQSSGARMEKSHEQDLKLREYRDKQGNVHHHTHTSSEYKDKERKAG